jgi:hypothetical protein
MSGNTLELRMVSGGHMRKRFRHPTLGTLNRFARSKKSTQTAGVWDATLAGLVQYLDEASTHQGAKTVLEILEAMLELDKIEESVWTERIDGPMMVMRGGRGVPNPLFKRIAPDKYRTQLEIDKRESEINRKLAEYRFLPSIFRLPDRQWSVTWQIAPRGPEKVKVHNGVMQMNDGIALQTILDIFRAGYVGRIRRCTHCGRWFFAKVGHQTFCSMKCQQKLYAQSEEWKKKRRNYMREYRRGTM